jgi:hypothetical protein
LDDIILAIKYRTQNLDRLGADADNIAHEVASNLLAKAEARLRKHVASLIAAERERCAGVCEGIAARPSIDWGAINPLADAAAEIRRGG